MTRRAVAPQTPTDEGEDDEVLQEDIYGAKGELVGLQVDSRNNR